MNRQQIKKWSLLRHLNFKGYKRTASGNPLNMVKVMSPSRLTIYGNAVQDGTPSPDAPVEVQLCGDRTGNLLDVTRISGNQIEVADNKIYLSGYSCSTNISPEYFLEMTGLNPGDTITCSNSAEVISGIANNVLGRVAFRTKNEGTTWVLCSNDTRTVTIPSDFNNDNYTNLLLYGAVIPDESDERPAVMSNLAIYKGSYTADTLPAYEPYGYKVSGRAEGLNLFTALGRSISEVADSGPMDKRVFGDNVIIECISSNGYVGRHKKIEYSVSDNIIDLYVSSGAGYGLGFDIDVFAGEQYSIRFTVLVGIADVSMSYYDADGVFISSTYKTSSTGTVFSSTAPDGAKKMILTFTETYGQTARHIKLSDIMLVKDEYTASSMPPYEPYQPPQEFAVYLPEQIAKVGDVADEVVVDMESKTAELVRRIERNEFKGTDAWKNDWFPAIVKNLPETAPAIPSARCVSNHFDHNGDTSVPIAQIANVVGTTISVARANLISGVTDAETFKTWLSDKNVYAYYPLAEPVTTDITSLQQWDVMPNIEGTVSITFDSTIPISNAEAEYHSKEYDAT